MSKIDEVRSDMVKAMKAGEKETKETLSMLLAALKNKAIDKRSDLTEEEEIQVVLKEIKQTKETLEMTPASSSGDHRRMQPPPAGAGAVRAKADGRGRDPGCDHSHSLRAWHRRPHRQG